MEETENDIYFDWLYLFCFPLSKGFSVITLQRRNNDTPHHMFIADYEVLYGRYLIRFSGKPKNTSTILSNRVNGEKSQLNLLTLT